MSVGKNKPLLDYVVTPHCAFELERRKIQEDRVRFVLKEPEQWLSVRPGRVAFQSKINIINKTYLLRVFVDIDRHPAEVVTAYLTSKISKYWRTET